MLNMIIKNECCILSNYYMIRNQKLKLKKIISSFFRLIFFKCIFNYEDKKNIFFNSVTNRKDHVTMFMKIYETCDNKSLLNFITIKRIRCDLFTFIYNYFKYKKEVKKILKKCDKKYCFFDIMYISIRLLILKNFFKDFKKNKFKNISNFVVLSDVQPMENILVKYFNEIGISTVTMQHGINVFEEKLTNIDSLNYMYECAEYALVWGQWTKDLINKFHPMCDVHICGNPCVTSEHFDIKDNCIAVVCDIPRFHKYNQDMISICQEFAKKNGKKVLIRLHPNDLNPTYLFDDNFCRYEKNINGAEFVVAHTTTMIITLIYNGKIVFRYKSDINYNLIDKEFEFSNITQLNEKYLIIKDINLYEISKRYIDCSGEASLEKYKNFFSNLGGIK